MNCLDEIVKQNAEAFRRSQRETRRKQKVKVTFRKPITSVPYQGRMARID